MIFGNKLVLAGIILECGAFFILMQHVAVSLQLLGFVMLHAAASFFVAQLVLLFLPEHYRQPRRAVLGLFFLLVFFVPLFSLIAVFAIVVVIRFFTKSIVDYPFVRIELPKFTLGGAGIRHSLGEGAIRTRLNTPGLPTEVRVKALLSAHAMSARFSIPMLKELLGDEADDLRLLAYGMLDQREKTLNALIHDVLKKLQGAHEPSLRELYQKQLAELYWAFAYEHLSEGDILSYMLTQAGHYAHAALETRADGDLYVLLAQILIRQERYQEAEEAFSRAIGLGMPVMRIQPYLAELAYMRGDYLALLQHLKQLPVNNQVQRIANIQRFWLGGEA